MHVDAPVLVLAKLLLQRSDNLSQRLTLVRHYVGEQQGIQQPIALRQVAADADAARLLAADQDLLFQHQVAHILEADPVFMQRAPVLRRDAVDHLGGVECAGHIARPALARQQPIQQHREDLVCVHHVALLIHRADAVRVAIGNKPGVALLGNHGQLRRADMRQDRLRIDPRKQRVQLVANLHKRNLRAGKDSSNHAATASIHAVDEELVARAANRVQIDELRNRRDVLRVEVNLFDLRRCR